MKNSIILFLFLVGFQNITAQKQIAIYWDASYSLKERKIDKELQYLNNYFKKEQTVSVTLVVFSNKIILQEKFNIETGNWSDLKHELQNTIYDGASSFSNLFTKNYDECFLFTDGIENLDKLKPPTDEPIHIVSTLPNSNTIKLKLIADLSSGSYVFLNNQFDKTESKEKIEQFSLGDNDGYITGFISGVEGALENVSIININSNKGIASGVDGSYKIKADEGDVIVYTYLSKKTINIRVAKANLINISMPNIDENLDEVVVSAEVEKEELINTGNGLVDKKRLGYDVQSISSDEISTIDTNVKQAVIAQFAGLEIPSGNWDKRTDLNQFVGRHKNMTILGSQFGLIILDGVPIAQPNFIPGAIPGGPQGLAVINRTNHIDPQTIKSITYLKGLAATNKYGAAGAGGVLLITTINAITESTEVKKKVKLGTTATYSGNAELIGELPNATYINILKTSKTIDEAFQNYLQQREEYGNKPEFYLDVYDYFKGWNNEMLSKRVLSNVYEIAFTKANILRALSYKQQADKNYSEAIITLEQVLKLKPTQSQSYRDLALAYTYDNRYNDGLKLYNNIDKNSNVNNSNFSGIKKTINNDVKNLISLHKKQLNVSGVNPFYLRPIKYKARIIFEWNDLDAEFDLSIINPQKRFFTWSHTQAENSQRISQEHEQGYGLEEFYLTSSDNGEWIFNLKYYGNYDNEEEPTYIKITTYKNFGSANETKDIQVVKLTKKNIEQTVAKVVVN